MMVRKVNQVYSDFSDELTSSLRDTAARGEDLFYSERTQEVSSREESESILSGEPCCIVASSGMLVGGMSCYYAEHLVQDAKNLIALTGYQAEGTPGRALERERVWTLDDGTSVTGVDIGRWNIRERCLRSGILLTVCTRGPQGTDPVGSERATA